MEALIALMAAGIIVIVALAAFVLGLHAGRGPRLPEVVPDAEEAARLQREAAQLQNMLNYTGSSVGQIDINRIGG